MIKNTQDRTHRKLDLHDLRRVRGGEMLAIDPYATTSTTTVQDADAARAKTADKAFAAMDGYIRG